MAKLLKGFWGKTWSRRDPGVKPARYLKSYPRRLRTADISPPSMADVARAIERTGNTAAGPDGIPFAFIREFAELAGPLLHDILTKLCAGVRPPKGFNHGLGVFLPKKKTNRAETTRPITINNTDNRVLASSVAGVILPHVASVLSIHQSAIIPGRDIIDNVDHITRHYYGALSKRKRLILLLTDFTKAFDSVHHSYIHAILKRMNFPLFFREVVQGFLSEVVVFPLLIRAGEPVLG